MIIESDSLKEFRYIDKLIQLAREGTKQTAISIWSNPLRYGMRVYVKPNQFSIMKTIDFLFVGAIVLVIAVVTFIGYHAITSGYGLLG